MNILYTIHAYAPAYRVGGPVLTLKATAERLVRIGHRVTVITSNANLESDLDVPVNRPVDVNGVAVWYFRRHSLLPRWIPGQNKFSGPMGYVYTPALRRHINTLATEADVIHTQMPFTYATRMAARAARSFRKPLFYSQHGVLDQTRLAFRSLKKRPYVSFVEKPAMRAAAMLIALTEWEHATYRGLGIQTPCAVVPNGIDPTDFSDTLGEDEVEREWRLPKSAKIVLFLGRLHPLKGPDRLVGAFLSIAAEYPDSVLVIAGPDEWGMETVLRRQAVAAGFGKRVIFPGMVSGKQKTAWLRRADLFCLPSESEGFSVAVLEAMACETAVLISPECHFDEVERHGVGWVISKDEKALAAGLRDALRNPALLRDMGRRAQCFALGNFSWDRIVAELADLYARAVSQSASHRVALSGASCAC